MNQALHLFQAALKCQLFIKYCSDKLFVWQMSFQSHLGKFLMTSTLQVPVLSFVVD